MSSKRSVVFPSVLHECKNEYRYMGDHVVFPSVLHECKNEYRYTGDHVVGWAYQMVVALDYIHSKEMLHRDIKPSK